MSYEKDVEAVKAVIQNYIDGTFKADIALLESVFHKGAIMSGYLADQLIVATPALFIEDIRSQPSMESNQDPFSAEITSLKVTGSIANVVVKETGFRGSGCLEDHFHLIKDGEWKIISKTFTTIDPTV